MNLSSILLEKTQKQKPQPEYGLNNSLGTKNPTNLDILSKFVSLFIYQQEFTTKMLNRVNAIQNLLTEFGYQASKRKSSSGSNHKAEPCFSPSDLSQTPLEHFSSINSKLETSLDSLSTTFDQFVAQIKNSKLYSLDLLKNKMVSKMTMTSTSFAGKGSRGASEIDFAALELGATLNLDYFSNVVGVTIPCFNADQSMVLVQANGTITLVQHGEVIYKNSFLGSKKTIFLL